MLKTWLELRLQSPPFVQSLLHFLPCSWGSMGAKIQDSLKPNTNYPLRMQSDLRCRSSHLTLKLPKNQPRVSLAQHTNYVDSWEKLKPQYNLYSPSKLYLLVHDTFSEFIKVKTPAKCTLKIQLCSSQLSDPPVHWKLLFREKFPLSALALSFLPIPVTRKAPISRHMGQRSSWTMLA